MGLEILTQAKQMLPTRMKKCDAAKKIAFPLFSLLITPNL